MRTTLARAVVAAAAAFLVGAAVVVAADPAFAAFPDQATVSIACDGAGYLDMQPVAWGAGWAYVGLRPTVTRQDDATVQELSGKVGTDTELQVSVRCRRAGPRQLVYTCGLRTSRDVTLTCAVLAVTPGAPFAGGSAVATGADGSTRERKLPLDKAGLGQAVRSVVLTDRNGQRVTVGLDPPAEVASDGQLRIVLAGRDLKAAEPRSLTVTVDLPGDLVYYPTAQDLPSEPGLERWFAWSPKHDLDSPSAIGMEDWVDGPAGAKGRVVRRGAELLIDGRPTKFWGLNLCYGACAPDHALADRRAKLYRKYGINAVRLHKYADGPGWAGIQAADSAAEFDPAALERLDYQVARFKEAGIFVKFSAQFGTVRLGPADQRDVPYLAEFGTPGPGKRVDTPASSFPHSPEIQAVHIRQTLNLLAHRNPYTGTTYAEEPAILALEILNEQSAMFYTAMAPLKASPTLRRLTGQRFCEWLRTRYGTHEKLVAAWGQAALDSFAGEGFPKVGEHLDQGNILPLGNPWFWDPGNLDGSQAFRRRRLLDSLEFLYGLQAAAYEHWVKAVRQAGYTGEILASNWQAGQNTSHYYNLHSDYGVGLIDRHNYHDGPTSLLSVPGSGLLSTGLQQVADRPFMLSEWIHTFPSEWSAEGPAIIGAYGLGLQDWDVSFLFQNKDDGTFRDQLGRDRWEVTTPTILGLFPAVARQVRRQDVKPAELAAPRYVHLPSLRDGRLGFTDRVTQDYDTKSFDSDRVPGRALAVVRCVVEFTDAYRETPALDLARFLDGDAVVSSTRQLRWTSGRGAADGHFTMDTPGTKAVVGFARDRTCALGEVSITSRNPFAAVYVTARGRDETVATARQLLVVAMARARNTDMRWLGSTRLLDRGTPPVLVEPVVVDLALRRAGSPVVHVLDHDGLRTGATIPVANGTLTLDGATHKTAYYEIAY